ncbi:TrbG/VirB9 family P-type conjugative transfer protein [Legionella sp.]|uniref:TrbG/VirB9 family P-type conjugative transfer protein n=1 Tax=Legionella sp. TaxID=459 RepID=UPI003C9D0E17
MKKQIVASVLFLCQLGSTGYAALTPQSYSSDARITRVAYQDNNVVRLKGRAFVSTQILFSPQEHIVNVDGGDRDAWMVTLHDNLPNIAFIKPTVLNSDSNITIVTTRHTYYFHVTSNKAMDSGERSTYAVKFYYPQEEQQRLQASRAAQKRHRKAFLKANKHPKTYSWDYSFNGSPDLQPLHVFDDGVFTYFEMRPNQPMPAIFIVDNQHGEEAVTNIRRRDNYLVVHRTAPQFTLRMGANHVASIFNNKEIARIKSRRAA